MQEIRKQHNIRTINPSDCIAEVSRQSTSSHCARTVPTTALRPAAFPQISNCCRTSATVVHVGSEFTQRKYIMRIVVPATYAARALALATLQGTGNHVCSVPHGSSERSRVYSQLARGGVLYGPGLTDRGERWLSSVRRSDKASA